MKINVVVEVPDNWEKRLDMQPYIEQEIGADRWGWNYTDQSNSSFGAALVHLKAGLKVARSGWNGSGMFVYLVPENKYESSTKAASDAFGIMVPYRAYLALKTTQNDVATWAPSCSDALADDWMIVE